MIIIIRTMMMIKIIMIITIVIKEIQLYENQNSTYIIHCSK